MIVFQDIPGSAPVARFLEPLPSLRRVRLPGRALAAINCRSHPWRDDYRRVLAATFLRLTLVRLPPRQTRKRSAAPSFNGLYLDGQTAPHSLCLPPAPPTISADKKT